MEYIIGAFIIIFCLFLTGFFIRKKHYKEIDRLESWKINIMDRPVLDEMAKVKQLNMTGQTEELFEKWRHEWDEIVTTDLPDVEELLFDAEEYIDKYRFGKAKEVTALIEEKLSKTEEKIQCILTELNDLVGSEEKNRTEIEELKELYRECKKNLLAHRHSYGNAENELERELEEVIGKFQEFDEKTKNGNYLEAREIVLFIKERLEKIRQKMDAIPRLLLECQTNLPAQLNELKEGYREMVSQGYVLDHIPLEKETEQYEKQLEKFLSFIEKLEIEEVEKGIDELKDGIEFLFDLLEKEVFAKHFISKNVQGAKELLEASLEENEKLRMESEHVQESYHLPEQELEVLKRFEKHLAFLEKRYELLLNRIEQNDTAQTVLSEELQEMKAMLDAVRDEQRAFEEKLKALRKDEMEAREQVKDLTKKVGEMIRLVSKSNIPGLSQDYQYLLEEAKESIQNVIDRLEEKPLNMNSVRKYLEVAVLTVNKLTDSTNELVENAKLAEKVIQYGNRYRSRYPSVAKGLQEAEAAFRNYDYRLALEQAAASIEEIEPGALKKIETLLSEE
ncbi:septation ring formation regulator EzrA [Bacillus methanolicus]|uniref:Septation ring formation regulator EzrA n=1 Tax=Bacillus methanolicus (strain MGA3 / ATCC 53907) TaxID=796606 RepID=I3ECG2_BACMM|nr:septation ring formation regulator EzrA [Bacillus methanolicus]AIE61041.1 Septation ring formation regulator EzrA [Bacillus methanolicus MGA3]EIJ84183.1 septation ring formation regulator EzrA [Bacillus methanolicus MGA3]